jgi:hypothetical protein
MTTAGKAPILRGDRLNVAAKLSLGQRGRSKVTCIDVNRDVLALGTNTGSVFLCSRNAQTVIKMINVSSGAAGSRVQDSITYLKFRCEFNQLRAVRGNY